MDKFPRHIKTHIFNGVEYSIEYKRIPYEYEVVKRGKKRVKEKFKVFGLCDSPTEVIPTMTIDTAQGEQSTMNTHVHEALHATNFRLKEKTVINLADNVSAFLWRLGYRLVKK